MANPSKPAFAAPLRVCPRTPGQPRHDIHLMRLAAGEFRREADCARRGARIIPRPRDFVPRICHRLRSASADLPSEAERARSAIRASDCKRKGSASLRTHGASVRTPSRNLRNAGFGLETHDFSLDARSGGRRARWRNRRDLSPDLIMRVGFHNVELGRWIRLRS